MTVLKQATIDAKTGKISNVEFTLEELESYNLLEVEHLALQESREAEELAKAEARSAAEAKLLELGLTTEDLKALLG